MKKILVAFTMVAIMMIGVVACQQQDEPTTSEMMQELRDRSDGSMYQVFKVDGTDMKHTEYFDAIPYNDDFNFSIYDISEAQGNDIYGNEINGLGSTFKDGGRLYLDAREIGFNLGEGDKVMVVFENGYDDAIVEVVKLNDGRVADSVDVVEKHGFMVVDRQEKDEHHTTIVTEIIHGDEYGFELEEGEVVAKNIFDHTDFVVLTKEEAKGLNIGGIYLITFNHDYIDTIVENDLVIANKVFGQIIGDEI